MKRTIIFVFFVIAMSLLLISCGGSQTCSYASKEKTNPNPTEVTTVETVVAE